MRTLMLILAFSGTLALTAPARAQSELQKSLKDLDIAPHWIYDDLPKALEQARSSGKPLFIVMRCVPCLPGKTLDGHVMQPKEDLEKLEQNFVCVRIVQTKGLDLKLFQYDYDQSWCALFMNADQTLYGRYGTRASTGPQSDGLLTMAGLRKALERALELHKGYPGNKEQLAGKVARDADYRVPEEIPGLQDRAQVATTRQNCIHCHMVRENILRTKWQEKRLTPADLWVYPLPDNIGLKMDYEDGLLIKEVVPDSPAAKAGLAAGDSLVTLSGQPLLSVADIQWVLHKSPIEAQLAVTARRKTQSIAGTITLTGPWKEGNIAWRASSWFALRHGLATQPLPAESKEKLGLGDKDLAFVIKGLYGRGGPPLQKAGLKPGDVIVAVDGVTQNISESQFLAQLRLKHGPADSVKLTILRGKDRLELVVPMW